MTNNYSRATLRFSCYDLLEIPAVAAAGFSTQFDFLPQDRLESLFPLLNSLGLDTKRCVQIHAAKHRRVTDNTPVVGYTVLGYERTDKAWLRSGKETLLAHIESNKCPHLKSELYHISREGIGEAGFKEMVRRSVGAEGTTGIVGKQEEEDYKEVSQLLKTLKDIQVGVRGNRDDVEE